MWMRLLICLVWDSLKGWYFACFIIKPSNTNMWIVKCYRLNNGNTFAVMSTLCNKVWNKIVRCGICRCRMRGNNPETITLSCYRLPRNFKNDTWCRNVTLGYGVLTGGIRPGVLVPQWVIEEPRFPQDLLDEQSICCRDQLKLGPVRVAV